MSADRIAAVRAYLAPPTDADRRRGAGQADWVYSRVASPLSRYAEFAADRGAAIDSALLGDVFVEVESASGEIGIGHSSGGFAAAAIIEGHLARLVLGERVTAHERTWDRMYHGSLHYGRKGIAIHAISAVDLALWDLHGKIVGAPGYELIGGRVHDAASVYATGPHPEVAAKLGFAGAKLPLQYGPSGGAEGLRHNVELAQQARDAVPEGFSLALDCWMSLTVPYAIELMDAIQPLGFQWLEEPLLPDDYAGLRQLRAQGNSRVQLAAGEHEYTAAGFRQLIDTGACAILQPDPSWCGGMTELLKIASLARAVGVPVVPHGCSAYSYHFVVTRPESDRAEYILAGSTGEELAPTASHLLGQPVPVNGRIDPGERPGFGLELNRDLPLLRPFDGEAWRWT
jgi:L-rhamnonate dehydratase